MRIGINSLFLQKPTTGMGQHLMRLLDGLDSLDEKDHEYVLLAPRFRRAYTVHGPKLSDRFREVEAVSALARLGENVEQVWWEQIGIVRAGIRERIDLLHSPYWSNPLWSPWPTVVTVHDVIQFVLPEYAWRKISRLYFGIVSRSARNAYQLVIAGRYQHLGHPLFPDPRQTVDRLGLEGSVIFTGQIREQDKAPLYSAATVFAFPSLYEGFGMPVLEAMACGTPVVTSNRSALPEVAGEAGLLVDPYDTDAICQAIAALLESQ